MILALIGTLGLFALAFLAAQRIQEKALAAKPEIPAIVVLPFENVGPREGQDIADAMTEEIATRLASLRGVRVIGRQSARAFIGSSRTPSQIAQDLNVQYVLTGTVRWDKSAEGKALIRVSPSLLKGDDGTQMWSEAYQTGLPGMFSVQAKIATQVANSLKLALLTPEKDAMVMRPTNDPDVYQKYLRARQLIEGTQVVPRIRAGMQLLTEATREDPKFLQAWAHLSIAHTRLFWFSGDRTQQRLDQAEAALRKAEAIEKSSPDVHLARGVLLFFGRRELEGALDEFKLVTSARPSDATALLYIPAINRRLGRMDEAIEGWRLAASLDPKNPSNFLGLASTLMFLRRYPEAERNIDIARSLGPDNPEAVRLKAAIALEARGNVQEAIEHLRVSRRSISGAALTSLLQSMTWPAVEDPDLRRYMIDDRPGDSTSLGLFYANKLQLFYYIGDSTRVREYADSAQHALESDIASSPDPVPFYEQLAIVHATRGHRADALRAMASADQLYGVNRDVFAGAQRENLRVRMFTLLGDYTTALDRMEKRVDVDGGMSRFYVRRDPVYSRLVSNPRYRRIVGL